MSATTTELEGLETGRAISGGITPLPRLGFLGVGWIGRHRMEAIAKSGTAEIVAIADTVEANRAEAAKIAPKSAKVGSLDEMLDLGVDGVVIATPSALPSNSRRVVCRPARPCSTAMQLRHRSSPLR